MSPERFTHDVFLSHSSKAQAMVHPLAQRYPADWRDSMPVVLGALKETRG